ncbi:uncharacterized protein LOC134228176 [Armigeres subalbatus]|uniref:uncharacterized protein LOC134228176 n=1 Tax=Armigeres subalbatus TaxID=124917 RepID=UPI002ED382D8
MKAFLLALIIIHEVNSFATNISHIPGEEVKHVSNADLLLSRRKRFLVLPTGGIVILTIAAAKYLIFNSHGPTGYYQLIEYDMYYPAPDLKSRITQYQLGEVLTKPTGPILPPPMPPVTPPLPTTRLTPAPPTPPMTATTSMPPMEDPHHHHFGHEISEMELQEYLKSHPDTWVPPGYVKDRSDWFPQGTYNPYDRNSMTQTYASAMNSYSPSEEVYEEDPYAREFREDRYNISQHRDWEHFHHYRERRDLYHAVENAFGDDFRSKIQPCIMRAICEARNLLPSRGNSLVVDIVRLMFSVPLKDDLQDEYSRAMRHDNMNCTEVYGKECAVSILSLILFGKFESSHL